MQRFEGISMSSKEQDVDRGLPNKTKDLSQLPDGLV